MEKTFWSCAATLDFISEEKLDILVPAGLRAIMIGVQTGAERVNLDIYNRRFKNRLFFEKAELIDRKFHKQMIVLLDFMIHCPYETEADRAETVKLLCRMPDWFVPNIYRFTFYPRTPIYERAVREGKIDRSPAVYSGIDFYPFWYKGYSFMTHVLVLTAAANYILPKWIKRMFCSPHLPALGKFIPQRLLDLIPWKSVYLRLWARNHRAIYSKTPAHHEAFIRRDHAEGSRPGRSGSGSGDSRSSRTSPCTGASCGRRLGTDAGSDSVGIRSPTTGTGRRSASGWKWSW